jgi:hypothetical protein
MRENFQTFLSKTCNMVLVNPKNRYVDLVEKNNKLSNGIHHGITPVTPKVVQPHFFD